MEPAHLVVFNLTLLAALVSPGPALLLALRTTLRAGTRAGIATGAGLGLMAAAWTGVALLGLDAVLAAFPFAYVAMKILGAGYLLYLAWGMWRDARTPVQGGTVPGGQAFLNGLLVNIGNPKAVLFASAVLIVIFPPGLSPTEKMLVVANHFVVELAAYVIFALVLSTRPAREGYLALKPLFDRLAAGVLGLLGLRLIAGP